MCGDGMVHDMRGVVWCGQVATHKTHKFDGHGQANGQKKTNVYNTPYAISGLF